ncbi:glutamyl-tRNA reductase [Amphibacillus sp. MSJ-3]|uniref:glutamyl-tRNA reductase n=1 Tax=Amphibacillus sp. MSJ-3 TaxID=2841505 RepID=UPI001C0EE996|nr:glutamyl-tRNA reductase [Amphibacillus sp. MSJ-3]MBU5595301.1 glutamyl-tRNA reductase [Amphibacillus sp. MSJ-3]
MHIIQVGVSHQIASLEIRERFNFTEESIKQAMLSLQEYDEIDENVIISTCNRVEIYVVTANSHVAILSIKQFLADWFQLSFNEITLLFSSLKDEKALEHLFKLAVGLDSMIIGETQILGQVKRAFFTAQEIKVSRKIFNELFKRVITFAKKAHHNTGIGRRAVSVSYAAIELSKKVYGNLQGKHVAILGAGSTSELTLKNLQGSGVSQITIVNRTFERAAKLAHKYSAQAVPIEELPRTLTKINILISSTRAPTPVLTRKMLDRILIERKGIPLLLIDLAVPRDIDYRVCELNGVYLYNIDDLHRVVNKNLKIREKIAYSLYQQIETEVTSFQQWLERLAAIPVIEALQAKGKLIQETTLESIYRKVPDLSEREMKVLKKHTKSIVHQLLNEPIHYLKDVGSEEDRLEMACLMFGLNDQTLR